MIFRVHLFFLYHVPFSLPCSLVMQSPIVSAFVLAQYSIKTASGSIHTALAFFLALSCSLFFALLSCGAVAYWLCFCVIAWYSIEAASRSIHTALAFFLTLSRSLFFALLSCGAVAYWLCFCVIARYSIEAASRSIHTLLAFVSATGPHACHVCMPVLLYCPS